MTSRPSDKWKTPEQHDQDGSYTASFWPLISFDKLERYAEELRLARGHSSPCRANREKYAKGGDAVVVELAFDDGEVWVARLLAPVNVCGIAPSAARLAREMEAQVATMKYIKEKTKIPLPTVIAYSASIDNIVGIPFMIMSAVHGWTINDLEVNLEDPSLFVDRYINNLVLLFAELTELRFDRIGSLYLDPADRTGYAIGPLASTGLGPFETAFDYYTSCAESMEKQHLTIPDDTPDEREGRGLVIWLFRLGLSSVASSRENNGPFFLAHNDLHGGNTLSDKNGNILGIIDWDSAAVLPVETFAAQCVDCIVNVYAPQPWPNLPLHHKFGAALEQLEPLSTTLPSGRTLEQVHSSPMTCLCGTYKRLLEGPDACREELYAEMLADLVLGTHDTATLKSSPLFKEWYTSTLQRLQLS